MHVILYNVNKSLNIEHGETEIITDEVQTIQRSKKGKQTMMWKTLQMEHHDRHTKPSYTYVLVSELCKI